VKHTFYCQYNFCVSLTVFDAIKSKLGITPELLRFEHLLFSCFVSLVCWEILRYFRMSSGELCSCNLFVMHSRQETGAWKLCPCNGKPNMKLFASSHVINEKFRKQWKQMSKMRWWCPHRETIEPTWLSVWIIYFSFFIVLITRSVSESNYWVMLLCNIAVGLGLWDHT
jgi:hypothetical protein